MMDGDYRDPIALAVMQQQQQQQQLRQRRPFTPQVPQAPLAAPRPAPTMGTPAPRQPEAPNPYGFESGYKAATATPTGASLGDWKNLYNKIFGAADMSGSAAP